MSKNPIVPYILIFSLGLGLIFFMSLWGLEQRAEIANQGEAGETDEVTANFEPETYAQSKCISCHGGNLEGGAVGPNLHGLTLSKEEIVDVLKNGKGSMMPPNTVPAEHVDEMADYILSLK